MASANKVNAVVVVVCLRPSSKLVVSVCVVAAAAAVNVAIKTRKVGGDGQLS